MAKMFYSLEEAAAKLGRSTQEVSAMADRKELEVFRDRDRIMLKVEQVDLLASGKPGRKATGEDIIPLASDSGELEPISASSSGSGGSFNADAKEQTGVNIFALETDGTDESDPSAVTRVTPTQSILSQDPGKSGSGLLDLTREIDETSLGVTSLEDAYSASGSADQSAAGSSGSADAALGGGGLFESPAGGDQGAGMTPMMAAYAEAYDGPGSGLVGGLALGSLICLGVTAFAVLLAISGATTGAGFLGLLGDNLWAFVGGFAGLAIFAGFIGWLIGKRS